MALWYGHLFREETVEDQAAQNSLVAAAKKGNIRELQEASRVDQTEEAVDDTSEQLKPHKTSPVIIDPTRPVSNITFSAGDRHLKIETRYLF